MSSAVRNYSYRPEKQCTGSAARPLCPHRHRRYGMTCAEWAAMLWETGNRCEICGILGTETPHGYLVIDHDYRYGKDAVRGLLCSNCNTLIGRSTSVIDIRAATRYLVNPWFRRHRSFGTNYKPEIIPEFVG